MSARVHISRQPNTPQRQPNTPQTTKNWRYLKSAFILAMAVLLAGAPGCTRVSRWVHQGFKVGPDYCRPPAPVAENWIDYENPDVDSVTMEYVDWWRVFDDPMMDELIDTASQQNLTLQTAGMRILAARARLRIAQGSLFPQAQQAYGDFTRVNGSSTTANVFPVNDFDIVDTGFNASWELDFWGRFRRAIEAENAIMNSEIENYDNVLVVLQAEVAAAYIQFRTLQQRRELAAKNVKLQKRTLQIADVRFRNGEADEVDVVQAKQNLATTQSLIPQLESGIRQTGNAICVLLGLPPQDLLPDLGIGPIPQAPAQILVGIPAELLRRRPDVRRAERLAAAQSAAIGIAESDFYPRIAITGFIGLESEDLSKMFNSESLAGQIGPGFQWNILNYGRIRNNVRANEARFYELVYDYQNAVLEANREVEDGIVSFLRERDRVVALDEAATQAARAVEISTTKYERGRGSFLPVVYMQEILTDRQDELTESRGTVAGNLVSIYKALGGGWQVRTMGTSMPLDGSTFEDEIPAEEVESPTTEEAAEAEPAAEPTPTTGEEDADATAEQAIDPAPAEEPDSL